MHGSLIAIELTAGAAILAVWFELRLGTRRPAALTHRVAHTAAAFVCLRAAGYALGHLVHDGTPRSLTLGLLFVLFLPTLVYGFVVAMWLLRTLKEIAA